MKKQLLAISVIVFALCLSAGAEVITRVRVVGQRVNLRAKAEATSEVVGQVGEGDILEAKSFMDEWVEVVPPESVDLWVYGELVRDNTVNGSTLNVRAGPGLTYSVVGDLVRGTAIQPRGEHAGWLKIAPDAACSLWVNRLFVQVLQPEKMKSSAVEPPAQKPEPPISVDPAQAEMPGPDIAPPIVKPTPVPAAQPPPPVTPVKAEEPPPQLPTKFVLIPLEGQGKVVQREGELRLSGFVIGKPSRFRLAKTTGRRIDTICYLYGNNSQLNDLLGQRLLVRGREYWVRGVRYPVVIPDQIIPRAAQ
ncbi:MAG TPA: SH3 domain-containing protein [Kiritimatiellia bacterium]|nr:SH3 domain-containing protein [Kiritimatiellia bacterium]